jgi:hypothetical protein
MNPARSIGPAVVSGDLHALWLYILAPICGASLAALTYQFVRSEATHSAPAETAQLDGEPARSEAQT